MKSPRFFYFPPWRKQFFFSEGLFTGRIHPTLFYQPYVTGSKIAWWAWTRFRAFKSFFQADRAGLPAAFHAIVAKLDLHQDWEFQVNAGTPGPEQKMTLIAYGPLGERVFVKAGQSEAARRLIANEAEALLFLKGIFGTPKVIEYQPSEDISVLSTEVIDLPKYVNTNLTATEFKIIKQIGELKPSRESGSYRYFFAHGDCCSWNFLDGEMAPVLIDWEMSGFYPAGYDLFTFIFQTSFLLKPATSVAEIFTESQQFISDYFSQLLPGSDPRDYLGAFAGLKVESERGKENTTLLRRYMELSEFAGL